MPEFSKPAPAITPEMQEFFAGARAGRLMLQKCEQCGKLRFPAHEFCSACSSTRSNWVPVSGRGEIFSFNIMHQVYHPGFAAEVPYAVVVVQLEEGCKFVSNLLGVKPHEIKCGMPVEVMFDHVAGPDGKVADSGLIAPGATWSWLPKTPQSVAYHLASNAKITGVVTFEGGARRQVSVLPIPR